MSSQQNLNNWRLYADRFVWSDETALSLIPQSISDEEVREYLYVYHGDTISIEEVKRWRVEPVKEQ